MSASPRRGARKSSRQEPLLRVSLLRRLLPKRGHAHRVFCRCCRRVAGVGPACAPGRCPERVPARDLQRDRKATVLAVSAGNGTAARLADDVRRLSAEHVRRRNRTHRVPPVPGRLAAAASRRHDLRARARGLPAGQLQRGWPHALHPLSSGKSPGPLRQHRLSRLPRWHDRSERGPGFVPLGGRVAA